ncbi:MAG: 4,5-DOPA dioxygenase extradiol [Crocinitomicaceae bacterium]
MERIDFIRNLSLLTIAGCTMKANALGKLVDAFPLSSKMPVLFLGHGNPMNAIEDNEFVQSFKKLGQELETPKAILCISAHWETKGTKITAMETPRTIHDFGGFPQALFDVQYPAKGSPELAKQTKDLISKTEIELDHEWGLDHGAWTVIKHLYPEANIPVIQMSLDYSQAPQYHYELAQELDTLRNHGVLIIGSGNIVHNLRKIAWDKVKDPFAWDWAEEANEKMKSLILSGNHKDLIHYTKQGEAFLQSIPTAEHYLPLLYTLGLKNEKENVHLFNDQIIGGSLSMLSLKVG